MARLAGKVALISGGARGQGAVEAKMFTQEGAQVVFGDILDAEGTQVEVVMRARGGNATYVHLHVTREEDWQRAVQTAESTYGVERRSNALSQTLYKCLNGPMHRGGLFGHGEVTGLT